MDVRLVPRAPPREAARVARGRPRPAQGGLRLLRSGARPDDRGGTRHGCAVRPVPEPVRPLPAQRAPHGGGMSVREGTPAELRELYEAYFAELWQRPWPAVAP